MRTPALSFPRRIAFGAGLALLAAGLTPLAAQASQLARHRHLRGLRRGRQCQRASTTRDFVELSNPTGAPVGLAGKYIHYRSGAGGSGGSTRRPHGVDSRRRPLPHPDERHGCRSVRPCRPLTPAAASFAMAAAGGQVFLLDNATAITTTGQPGRRRRHHRHGRGHRSNQLRDRGSDRRRDRDELGEPDSRRRRQEQPGVRALQPPAPRTPRSPSTPTLRWWGPWPTSRSPWTRRSRRSRSRPPTARRPTHGPLPVCPAGLSIDAATGEISGTPTAVGISDGHRHGRPTTTTPPVRPSSPSR